jgi:hypothetical protein
MSSRSWSAPAGDAADHEVSRRNDAARNDAVTAKVIDFIVPSPCSFLLITRDAFLKNRSVTLPVKSVRR